MQALTRRGLFGRFVRRLVEAQQRERQQIITEIARIKNLMPLLMKRRNGGYWSASERAELVLQLHALAHLSPYLFVLALPGSFLFLPFLAWWLDRRRRRRPLVDKRPYEPQGK